VPASDGVGTVAVLPPGSVDSRGVFVAAVLAAGAVVWFGGTLLVDAWWDRWRDDGRLVDPLEPSKLQSVAEEAQTWLNDRP
jgi:hypothetical protein